MITFAQQTAQYVRIEQNGSDNRRWWLIHEMTITSGGIDNGNNNGLPASIHEDIVRITDISPEEILRNPSGEGWKDNYSVGDRYYCDTTRDHRVNHLLVNTPFGTIRAEEACDIIGPRAGSNGNPIYNDIQCGNGLDNEMYCPGRTGIGREGCVQIGPRWNFN